MADAYAGLRRPAGSRVLELSAVQPTTNQLTSLDDLPDVHQPRPPLEKAVATLRAGSAAL